MSSLTKIWLTLPGDTETVSLQSEVVNIYMLKMRCCLLRVFSSWTRYVEAGDCADVVDVTLTCLIEDFLSHFSQGMRLLVD